MYLAADEFGLQFVTVQARQVEVEQQAAGIARAIVLQKVLGALVQFPSLKKRG